MTQEEILDYNKRCAEFLGAKNLGKLGYSDSDYYEHELFETTVWSNQYQEWVDVNNMSLYVMKFPSDWNWIMEVYVKINESKITTHMNGISDSITPYIEKKRPIVKAIIDSKKEEAVEAINQFLIWYNEKDNK